MQLLQKSIVRHVPARKCDEDDGASGPAQQPDFREGRVFLCFPAYAVVGIEKQNVGSIKRASLAYTPRMSFDSGWHRLAMKQRSFRPDHRLFEGGNAAFRQGRKTCVQFLVKCAPCRLVSPFKMPTIRAPIVTRSVVPCAMAGGAAISGVSAPPAIGHARSCCGWIPSCVPAGRSNSNAIFPSFVHTTRARCHPRS